MTDKSIKDDNAIMMIHRYKTNTENYLCKNINCNECFLCYQACHILNPHQKITILQSRLTNIYTETD